MEQVQKTIETHDGELYGYKGVGGLKSKVQSLENQREFTEQQRSHWTDYISLIIAAVAVIIAILKH